MELCRCLVEEAGVAVSVPTLCRTLKALRLPLKKRRFTPANSRRGGSARYAGINAVPFGVVEVARLTVERCRIAAEVTHVRRQRAAAPAVLMHGERRLHDDALGAPAIGASAVGAAFAKAAQGCSHAAAQATELPGPSGCRRFRIAAGADAQLVFHLSDRVEPTGRGSSHKMGLRCGL